MRLTLDNGTVLDGRDRFNLAVVSDSSNRRRYVQVLSDLERYVPLPDWRSWIDANAHRTSFGMGFSVRRIPDQLEVRWEGYKRRPLPAGIVGYVANRRQALQLMLERSIIILPDAVEGDAAVYRTVAELMGRICPAARDEGHADVADDAPPGQSRVRGALAEV